MLVLGSSLVVPLIKVVRSFSTYFFPSSWSTFAWLSAQSSFSPMFFITSLTFCLKILKAGTDQYPQLHMSPLIFPSPIITLQLGQFSLNRFFLALNIIHFCLLMKIQLQIDLPLWWWSKQSDLSNKLALQFPQTNTLSTLTGFRSCCSWSCLS